ncbi:CDP-diacylglycerol--glycerol-3-phosphate 3-phosphatidyltransferase [Mycoplasmopsis gallinarum]
MKNFFNKISIPNWLTILRMVLILPLIIIFGIAISNVWYSTGQNFNYFFMKKTSYIHLWLGMLLIFVIAMITDFLDGYIARKYKSTTSFGKLFDPLADKIIITSSLIFFAILGILRYELVILFVIRDLLVDGSRVIMAKNNLDIKASIWGKIKTFSQTIGIIVIFLSFYIYLNVKNVDHSVNSLKIQENLFIINQVIFSIILLTSIISGAQYMWKIRKFLKLK